MNRKFAFALTVALLGTAVPAEAGPTLRAEVHLVVPSVSDDDPANGLTCGTLPVTDPTVEGDVQSAVMYGGPLVASEPVLQTMQMTCTVQVGFAAATHAGFDTCSLPSVSLPGVAFVPPAGCTYVAPQGVTVWLCTQVTVGGITYYWDPQGFGGHLPLRGTWSTSASVPCVPAIAQGIDPQFFEDVVDPVICPILAMLAPRLLPVLEVTTTGDVYILRALVWDCPPYT